MVLRFRYQWEMGLGITGEWAREFCEEAWVAKSPGAVFRYTQFLSYRP